MFAPLARHRIIVVAASRLSALHAFRLAAIVASSPFVLTPFVIPLANGSVRILSPFSVAIAHRFAIVGGMFGVNRNTNTHGYLVDQVNSLM